jgi:hypothetical protein
MFPAFCPDENSQNEEQDMENSADCLTKRFNLHRASKDGDNGAVEIPQTAKRITNLNCHLH